MKSILLKVVGLAALLAGWCLVAGAADGGHGAVRAILV